MTPSRRPAAILLLVVAGACGGASCGGEKSGAKGDAGAGATGAAAERARALGGDGKLTIAMIGKSSANPVFLAARRGAEAAARDFAREHAVPIEVAWLTPPQEDGQVQAQRVAQAVNEGADAILIAASDAGKVAGAIDDAVGRGVPVMTFDSDVPQSRRFAFYGADDAAAGAQVMTELAALMGGKGGVAVLAGNQNAPNLQRRVQGVRTAAAKLPGVKLVGTFYHTETPQDAVAEVVRVNNAYPDVQGWAMVGGWPLYTPAMLDDASLRRLKVVSVDGIPAQLPYVERGVVPVLLAQPVYRWGYEGVRTVVDKVVLGKEVPRVIPMPLVRVTRENLGEWRRQLAEWGMTDGGAAAPAAAR